MKIKFDPKETLAVIVNTLAAGIIMANGGSEEQAAVAGAVLEGTVKGINVNQSIAEKMERNIRSAIETALDKPDYEIPDSCKRQLKEEILSRDNILNYLGRQDQQKVLVSQIKTISEKNEECDSDTFPADLISDNIIKELHKVITGDSELIGYVTFNQILGIQNDITENKEILVDILKHMEIKDKDITQEDIAVYAQSSAIKMASYFSEVLFAEKESSNPHRLSDMYVENRFEDSEGNQYCNFDILFKSLPQNKNLLIEGAPGIGKSTQIMKIAQLYVKGEVFQGKNVFFIRGKDIRHSVGNVKQDILESIGLTEIEQLNHAILILDAYDEISYVSQGTDQNKEYLRKLFFELEETTLIITSRPDYIKDFYGLKVNILGFNPRQRRKYLENYNRNKIEEEQLTEAYISKLTLDDNQYDDKIYELLSIPMMLYLIVISYIDVDEIPDRYALYERVFGTNSAVGAIGRDRKLTQILWNDFYILASNIAHHMYMSNELNVEYDVVINMIDNMRLDENARNILKNRFGVEIYLQGEKNQLFTFIHTSIYEFFAAKWICREFKGLIQKAIYDEYNIEYSIKKLNEIFYSVAFQRNIFLYIMENIRRGELDSIYKNNDDKLLVLLKLFKELMNNNVCINVKESIPYMIQLKNMLLWIFNTFSIFLGRIEMDNIPYWIDINPDIVGFLIRSMEEQDYLFLCHMKLNNFGMEKTDFGNTFFIDNQLENADFSYSFCDSITAVAQHFDRMKMKQIDFYNIDLSHCSFEETDLRFADCRNAMFHNVSFKGADLRGIMFDDAVVSQCDFTGAHIFIEDFENVIFNQCTLDRAIVHDYEEDPNEEL